MKHVGVCAVTLLVGCAAGEPVLVTPMTPSAGDVAITQEALRRSLRDPGSAQFRDVVGYALADGGRIVCGEVNARNGFGGYVGFTPFYARLEGGAVVRQYVDDATGYGPATIGCARAAEGVISISR